jgi:hypothetical protein
MGTKFGYTRIRILLHWKSFQFLHEIFTAALLLCPYGTRRHSKTGANLQHDSEDGAWIPDTNILITNIRQSSTWQVYTQAITDSQQ